MGRWFALLSERTTIQNWSAQQRGAFERVRQQLFSDLRRLDERVRVAQMDLAASSPSQMTRLEREIRAAPMSRVDDVPAQQVIAKREAALRKFDTPAARRGARFVDDADIFAGSAPASPLARGGPNAASSRSRPDAPQ